MINKRSGIFDLIFIFLGNFTAAFGLAAFILPSNLITGGASGVGILFNHLFSFRVSTVVFIINIIMLVWGLIFLGKKFVAGTILSSILFPIFLRLLENQPSLSNISTDKMLCTVIGAILLGFGVGLVMRSGASTGGFDPIPLTLQKYFHLPVGLAAFGVDITILITQAFFSDKEALLYGIIFTIVSSFVLDRVTTIGEANVQVLTISSRSEEIRSAIINNCNMGATLLDIKTGYNNDVGHAVMSVIHKRSLNEIRKTILSIDSSAFIQIIDVNSVHGIGFTISREDAVSL